VVDIEAVIAHLRAAGVEASDAAPVGATGIRQTFVLDPDGNRVEFTQPA
jgi:catechol 2,3-dioxygenase-like lactoylglutathione lyase family enzyme